MRVAFRGQSRPGLGASDPPPTARGVRLDELEGVFAHPGLPGWMSHRPQTLEGRRMAETVREEGDERFELSDERSRLAFFTVLAEPSAVGGDRVAKFNVGPLRIARCRDNAAAVSLPKPSEIA